MFDLDPVVLQHVEVKLNWVADGLDVDDRTLAEVIGEQIEGRTGVDAIGGIRLRWKDRPCLLFASVSNEVVA